MPKLFIDTPHLVFEPHETQIDTPLDISKEEIKVLREYRESEYERLKDAVYQRRGWDSNGVPTLETIKKLGIDFPQVVTLIAREKSKCSPPNF